MSLNFFKIPYEKNDLEPFLSSETLTFHYEKHHKTYYDNLQNLIKGLELENKSLEEIIIISSRDEKLKSVYNNAAQVFNHDFYFRSLKRENNPSDYFINLINKNFGSWNNFLEEFKKKSLSQFGSGGFGWF